MPFEPNNENHAIVEVVFGIRLARNFSSKEIEALISEHGQFKTDLPKIGRTQVIQFAIGDGPPPQNFPIPQPAAGVTFDAMKKDGTLEWRLRADDNMLFVNCLSYSRWSEIWERARSYLSIAGDLVIGSDNFVTGLILQYIDVFRSTDNAENYNVRELLDDESKHLPASIFDCGPLWHLHQGWYRDGGQDFEGRLLERMHLDAVLENDKTFIVKMDSYVQIEYLRQQSWSSIFSGNSPIGDEAFDKLHNLDKNIITSVLTEEMAKRIGMNA